MEEKFLPAFGEAIFNFGKETMPDIAEIAVDSLLEDGILKDIPGVSFLLSAGRLVGDIRNAFFTKHVLVFTQQVNSGTISQEKIKQHYEELEKKPKKKLRELEIVLQSISRHKKYIQDKILANFYAAYCDPDVDFTWTQFELMSQITEGLFPYDLVELKKMYEAGKLEHGKFEVYTAARLNALSLVTYTIRDILLVYNDRPPEKPKEVTITQIGRDFWNYGMKGVEGELERLSTEGTIL